MNSGKLLTNSQIIIVEPLHKHERTNNSTFQNAEIFVDDGHAVVLQRETNYFSNVSATQNRNYPKGDLYHEEKTTIEEHLKVPPEMF